MPEPEYGSDYLLYKYITNPLAKKMCSFSPDLITAISVLFFIPLYYNIINRGNIYIGIAIITFIYFLDTLDGAVARKCDKCSKSGAYYDLVADTLKIVVITLAVYYCYIDTRKKIIFYLLVFFILYLIYYFFTIIKIVIKDIKNIKDEDDYFYTNFEEFFHNNLLVFNILLIIVIKKIVNY